MIRKDLLVVALANICIAFTLLITVPTRSATDGYDPWLDYNDDGTVNILDITSVAKAFLSAGNPTKNVVIMHSTSEQMADFNLSGRTVEGYDITTRGYRQVTLYVFLEGPLNSTTKLEVNVSFWIEGNDRAPLRDTFSVERLTGQNYISKTYDVIGSRLSFTLSTPADHFVFGRWATYMTT